MNAYSSGEILNRILINDQEIINWYSDYTFPKLTEKIEHLLSGSNIQKERLKEISKSFYYKQYENFRNEISQNQEKYENSINKSSLLGFSVQKILDEKNIYQYVNTKINEFVNKQYWKNNEHPETRSINIEQISSIVFKEFRKRIIDNASTNFNIGYLKGICRNETKTFFKHQLKSIKTDKEWIENISETNESDLMESCDEILQKILPEEDYQSVISNTEEAYKKVLTWLKDKANVSEKELQLLYLDIDEKKSQKEIARILKYSSSDVIKSSKARIMRKLRDFLDQGGF